ncbi:MAG: cyclic nucleotide-binding domain-containing protein [Phycisphaera sp.]|nr:cyclic nucleotide-binding domain-containing protein [Phycisphaera sp.]
MIHKVFGKSDTGLKRTTNQDALLIDQKLGLYIVCDGVGGRAAGQHASNSAGLIVQSFLQNNENVLKAYRDHPAPETQRMVTRLVEAAITDANNAIYSESRNNPQRAGMATTIVMLLVLGDRAVIAHVGDSRCYLMRHKELFLMTEDHSHLVEQLVQGRITRKQAEASSAGSLITRAIGFRPYVVPEVLAIELMSGDRFLLCSDGLTSYMDPATMADYLKVPASKGLIKSLIKFAYAKGGGDNVTVLVAEMESGNMAADINVNRKHSALRRSRLFEHVRYTEFVKLMAMFPVEDYPSNHAILTEGRDNDKLYAMVNGHVEVRKDNKMIAEFGPGSFFGEAGAINPGPASASVITTQPTQAMVIGRDRLLALTRSDPRTAVKMMWSMSSTLTQRLLRGQPELAWSDAPLPAKSRETHLFDELA